MSGLNIWTLVMWATMAVAQPTSPTPRELLLTDVRQRAGEDVKVGRAHASISDLTALYGAEAERASIPVRTIVSVYDVAFSEAEASSVVAKSSEQTHTQRRLDSRRHFAARPDLPRRPEERDQENTGISSQPDLCAGRRHQALPFHCAGELSGSSQETARADYVAVPTRPAAEDG